MNSRQLAGLGLVALLAGVFWFLPEGSTPGVDTNSAMPNGPAGDPTSCLPCHEQLVHEWQNSMHAAAFTDPQVRAPGQADGFRKTECLPCHAPRAVFDYGIQRDTRVVARVARRQDGVDCLACHGLADGQLAASRPGLGGAACRPTLRPELSLDVLCAPCHNQHNLHDEWRASPAFTAGKGCLDCHMQRVRRDGAEAGAPRSGRSHRFLGGRDKSLALEGLSLEHRVEPDPPRLVVTLTNQFAGHNLPSDSRNRALDLVVTLFDLSGTELPRLNPEDRHPGGETGTARLRFRNPYRSSGNPSTQLPAGASRSLDVPLPAEAVRARIELAYKLEPWISDELAVWSHRIDVEL